MTEGEENIIIKGVLLEAISRDFSEELSNNKEVSVSPRFKRQMMAMMDFLKAMNFKRWQLPFYRLIEKIWRIV